MEFEQKDPDSVFTISDKGEGYKKDHLAEKLIDAFMSRDQDHVISLSHIDANNIVWTRGRDIINKVVRRFYLDPEKILHENIFVRRQYLTASAIEGRRAEQLVKMTQTSLMGFTKDLFTRGGKGWL